MKSGLIALFFKFRYGISYVVSEHRAGFCPEAILNFSERTFLFRWLWKRFLKNAKGCTAVSEYLAAVLQNGLPWKK